MNKIPHLLKAFVAQPWAIEPTMLSLLVGVFQRKLSGEFLGGELHAQLGIPVPEEEKQRTQSRIAVIPIMGIIAQRAQSLGSSVDSIEARFDAAMASSKIDAILFDIDSPGGTVGGVPELAEKILQSRQDKPTMALANGMMASAAYWLGSAAGEIVATPSSDIGSIGVYMVHQDFSQHLEQEGIKLTTISAGKFKTEGIPTEPLAAEGLDFFQDRVDEVYGWFIRAVAQNRKDTQTNVRNGYGEGRVLGAAQSLRAGLIDRVATFDEAITRLSAKVTRSKGKRADLLRRRLSLDALRLDR